ncbi:phosphate acyltransferase PlsX [Bdellovibrionota bacterium]
MLENEKTTEKPTKIAVDVMSGDLGPTEAIKGAAEVTQETSINVLLVGDQAIIQEVLEKTPHNPGQISVLHAPTVITMEDSPREAVENKKDSSLFQAVKAAADNMTDAVVSAGNTGAYILCCSTLIPRIPGIKKTALSTVYPTHQKTPSGDRFALMLDVGATIRCTAEDLTQFAIMGAAYARDISYAKAPVVGLLNIGKEPHKGGETLTKTYNYLENIPGLKFLGNVEGNELPLGPVDVVVCEGFVGNAVIKLAEGLQDVAQNLGKAAFKRHFIWKVGILMLAGGLKQLKKITDYSTYGGAPILGFEQICIKAHGKSNAKAINNAIKVAAKAVRGKVPEDIRECVASFQAKLKSQAS